ncbi:structural maintenance of chromosomes protein 3-like protein 2 [Dinothrombium tinctorium]|uniref:Structural maintenance of chromosomes protein n=1 Tax=Dinothrombium tinctorium TaxID=1965070 RepID=A0A3S3PEQ0_9ACAR|nr:structural maintenance of chromosomes protein 3-like protein 2 [Dinothrombium tinctorium]
MYIKQVIIQGFRSYRDQTIVEPFSPRHNVIVGRNGSGKSNFFYAIQFVLSDEFSHLRPDQRQQLLHEGTGQRTMIAYVEIIFDNSDSRLPIDETEVTLRRQIGLKKDQYYLNKKIHTRSDVMNVLESAGFSRSNPYYIVKQGKINQMATAPDSQRLKILREVAGTRIYDERKEESRVLLRDTESKLEKIMDLLKYIEERLQTLEGEKEELKEYQKWDKMRRALEYTIYNQELEDARKKQRELETRRETSSSVTERLRENLQALVDEIKEFGRDLREVRTKLQTYRDEKEALQHEHSTFLKEKTRLELRLKDLLDEVEGDAKSEKRAEAELQNLKERIAEKQAELSQIKPEYEKMKQIEEECTRQLSLKEQKRSELYAKQGRGSQFTSKTERDMWIQNELKALKRNIFDKKQQIERLKQDLSQDEKRRKELETKIDELTKELENNRSSIDNQNKTFYDMKKKKDALQNERNELWRQENTMQQNLNMLNEDKSKKDQMLRSMVGKTILNGRDSVRRVLQLFKEKGGHYEQITRNYYGMLIENFDCGKEFYTAVEMTAGNKLFHHIVENDKVGTKILQEMNRLKLPGEVTFMPLNRLYVKDISYPETQDAIPMISRLQYDPKIEVTMKFIFGKVLICRSLEVATQLARSTSLDCITLDGDQVSHKGSLTGGYFDSRRSRLELHKTHTALMKEIQQQKEQLENHHNKLNDVESQINQIVSEMQRAETKNSKNKDTFDKMKTDIRLLRDELATIDRSRQPKERSLVSHESSLHSMESLEESLRSELQQDLLTQLSVTDQQEVDRLNDEIRNLTQKNKEAFSRRMHLEAQKNKLENLLNNNLCRRKDELEAALQEISVEDRKQKLESEQAELKSLSTRIEVVNEQMKKLDANIEEFTKKQKELQTQLEKKKSDERDTIERINEDSKDLEKITSKNSLLGKKIDECMRKIRELGTLPSDAETKYANLSLKQLYKKLQQCNQELQKYSHVNKKALDQYLDFSEKKEKLLERKADLDAGHKSIIELMAALEQRKYEAIQITFRQVSMFFSEVFKKLVPQGRASLDMKTTADSSETSDSGTASSGGITPVNNAPPSIDNFTGVSIRVSFTGSTAEMKDMQQLSGGQKSLVALAFIFAIQKCDPAPFYLFDEIDQALDPQHRKAVADMIYELSKDAQFITTTFRPELLERADKYYGVKFRNRVSHIEAVTYDEAHDFVEDDTQHA